MGDIKVFQYKGNDFLELPAERSSFVVLKDWLTQISEELNFPAKNRKQILIVADEIFTNIVSYGYPEKTGITIVQLSFDITNNIIELKFIDKGIAYNPLTEETPKLGEKNIGGLGIFMVKKIMDDIEYLRQDDCNILILRKAITI